METEILLKAIEAVKKGRDHSIATIVESSEKGTPRKPGANMIVYEDGSIFGTIGGGRHEKEAVKECLSAIKKKRSKLIHFDCSGNEKENSTICGGKFSVFIDPVVQQKHLIICGAGHIALALSLIAKILNFKVTVIDDRKEFANKKRFPHIDNIILGNHPKALKKMTIDKNSYVMITTHDHKYDFDCLKTVIKSEAGYIGVISSKTKSLKFHEQLKRSGHTKNQLSKIDMPCGIDIGAQTPEEIAISISAKLIMISNYQYLGSTKFKK